MLRISKLTDYGTVILADLATRDARVASAAEVAAATVLASRRVRKLLKMLGKSGLVVATRGLRAATAWPVNPRPSAPPRYRRLEGPVSITDCSTTHRHCEIEAQCTVGEHGKTSTLPSAGRCAISV